jgi:hypothetical protein
LTEYFHFRYTITQFDHERIPERVVHAISGVHGYFELFELQSDVTKAGVLTDTSREPPVFVRFSTVQDSRGSADKSEITLHIQNLSVLKARIPITRVSCSNRLFSFTISMSCNLRPYSEAHRITDIRFRSIPVFKYGIHLLPFVSIVFFIDISSKSSISSMFTCSQIV